MDRSYPAESTEHFLQLPHARQLWKVQRLRNKANTHWQTRYRVTPIEA